MLTAALVSLSSGVPRRTRRQVAADDDDVRAAPPMVGGAVRRRHRVVPGARALGDDRPLPRAHAAGAPDRIRRGDRVPRCSRCGPGGRAARRRRGGREGRRAAVRAVRRHLVVRARRTRRQDDARHRRAGQRPQLGRGLDRSHRGHGAGRRRGDRGGPTAAQAAARALPARMASVLFLLFGLWMLFDGGTRAAAGSRSASPRTVAVVAVVTAVSRWLLRRREAAMSLASPDRSNRRRIYS